MARIILSPNESFEHYHSHESRTIHVKGDIQITVGGMSYRMKNKECFDVPGNTPHTIINVGKEDAEVGCIGVGKSMQHKA
ncbi:MAG: cupin domain-containing protein [Marinobacter sp.]|uniref:cupin domain-containing protein n=1 Tax=Marinobacter sp. TaxID=50741 RepID=UPI0032970419